MGVMASVLTAAYTMLLARAGESIALVFLFVSVCLSNPPPGDGAMGIKCFFTGEGMWSFPGDGYLALPVWVPAPPPPPARVM